jgi:hypothetical protein
MADAGGRWNGKLGRGSPPEAVPGGRGGEATQGGYPRGVHRRGVHRRGYTGGGYTGGVPNSAMANLVIMARIAIPSLPKGEAPLHHASAPCGSSWLGAPKEVPRPHRSPREIARRGPRARSRSVPAGHAARGGTGPPHSLEGVARHCHDGKPCHPGIFRGVRGVLGVRRGLRVRRVPRVRRGLRVATRRGASGDAPSGQPLAGSSTSRWATRSTRISRARAAISSSDGESR